MRNKHIQYRNSILELLASGFLLSRAGIAICLIEKADFSQILFYRSISLSIKILAILMLIKRIKCSNQFRKLI